MSGLQGPVTLSPEGPADQVSETLLIIDNQDNTPRLAT